MPPLNIGGNVPCMSSWGLRGTNQSKYTKLRARQNAEIKHYNPNYLYTLLATVFLVIILKTIYYGKNFKN